MLSSLKFYYYVIRNDSRKYKIVTSTESFAFLAFLPFLLMVLTCISIIVINPSLFSLKIIIFWVIIAMGNTLLLIYTDEQGYLIKENSQLIKERSYLIKENRELESTIKILKAKIREDYKRKNYEKSSYDYYNNYYNFKNYYNNREQYYDKNMINAMKLLGLQKNFTTKDLKTAYRKLARIHHPDVGGTEENFKRLNKAYQYIINNM